MPSRFAWVALTAACVLTGCDSESKRNGAVITGGDPQRGATQIYRHGCGSCHSIPGISGAQGRVGPSLAGLGSRIYVAGSLVNQPANLIHWIQDPHSVNEKTVMPNLGVTAHDATDIAAYLYSLR